MPLRRQLNYLVVSEPALPYFVLRFILCQTTVCSGCRILEIKFSVLFMSGIVRIISLWRLQSGGMLRYLCWKKCIVFANKRK